MKPLVRNGLLAMVGVGALALVAL
ncbi:MAG: hypothetical protein RLZZ182_594, partial [Pseudomonadota bacterium]